MSEQANVLWGYQEKENILGQPPQFIQGIVYELGESREPEKRDNVRSLAVENGVAKVTELFGYNTDVDDKYKGGSEEKHLTKIDALLPLSKLSPDVGVSEKFNFSNVSSKDQSESGLLSADKCVKFLQEQIKKAKQEKGIVDRIPTATLLGIISNRILNE
ncbi:MAG: hypothetical protein GY804_02130 [Alphaproteobacteria bacterium]|nr:hypothetical protein [Alphaproteobacteria bacterium]